MHFARVPIPYLKLPWGHTVLTLLQDWASLPEGKIEIQGKWRTAQVLKIARVSGDLKGWSTICRNLHLATVVVGSFWFCFISVWKNIS
jgi:hypothetical protein